MISSPLSHGRRPSQAAALYSATETEGQPAAKARSATGSDVVDDGDLSLSIEATGEVFVDEAFGGGSKPIETGPGPSNSIPHNHRPDGEDRDLVESLRVFIQSHIEAKTRANSATLRPAKASKGVAPSILAAFDDAEDAGETAGETETLEDPSDSEGSFPETTIFPMSILTGRGVEECMDWIVQKSLAAGKGDGERERHGKSPQSAKD